ncbi:MAG: tRNA pseudouridine(13) synthase TruD [Candidatus Bathyarchaeota archaeon]|nr:tRNA pseudouridine(13) synthase TruD [Candidatus Bathyarchaeota archaeon]
MEISLDLPYITSDLPSIGGQVRETPDHFVVEELPLYDPQGEGQHTPKSEANRRAKFILTYSIFRV